MTFFEKYFRKNAESEHDKGVRFETLMQACLKSDPRYKDRFDHLWLWRNFTAKTDFETKDLGIDLIAHYIDGTMDVNRRAKILNWKEINNPRYILDLLLTIINLSIQRVDIIQSLPKLNFDEK